VPSRCLHRVLAGARARRRSASEVFISFERKGGYGDYGDTLPIPLSIVGFGPLFRGLGSRPVRAVPPDAREGSTSASLARATSRAGVFCEKRREPTKLPGPVGERPRAGDLRSRGGISDIVRRRRDASAGPAIRLGAISAEPAGRARSFACREREGLFPRALPSRRSA
jgi:hypothetical protein